MAGTSQDKPGHDDKEDPHPFPLVLVFFAPHQKKALQIDPLPGDHKNKS
jgi:hypothetical protein